METFRCSCCNNLKPNSSLVYKPWDSEKMPLNLSEIVGICKKCNALMKKYKTYRVETMLRIIDKKNRELDKICREYLEDNWHPNSSGDLLKKLNKFCAKWKIK